MSSLNEKPAERSPRFMKIVVAVVLLLLAVSLGYQWWSARQSAIVPPARATRDFVVTWRCLSCGHAVQGRAGPGPKKCPACGRDNMYASLRWGCPVHGAKNVAFQYDEEGQPTQIKVEQADWVPAYGEQGWNIRCPTCGAAMNPVEVPNPAGDSN
ncbi:MAG TPA: hypothetical protein PLL20_14245 [Phycisphaerae bacterium]|nr:hypothetical protein [Phycisphaerae bacterium]HRR83919.1 hypothetical protein [Phycisphaerae bacterium]